LTQRLVLLLKDITITIRDESMMTGKVCSMCHRACIVQHTSEQFEDEVFCCEVCMERFIKFKQAKQVCACCGRTGNMQFASKCKPFRYFCNKLCLDRWTRFNTKPS
jgi:hypothetical protein